MVQPGRCRVQKIIRQKGFAEFLGLPLPSFEKALRFDPDFAHCRPIKLGVRAVGYEFDDALRVALIKICRRDGVPPERLEAEVEKRLIEEHARAELIAEARARLEAKTKTNRKSSKQLEAA
jgi:hypothetical protein